MGDPTNPKTWSGTPFNLYSELKNMNYLGSAFNSYALDNKLEKILIKLIAKFYYSNSVDLGRGYFERYKNAKKVIVETSKSSTNLTLHTGTFDLPFYKLPKNQKHYLFCDSTWNLWSSCSTDMKGYTSKLMEDAEKLERKAYYQMEHIFPISEYVKENLVTHYGVNPKKITVVGTGAGVIKPYFGEKDYSNGKILFAAKGRFEDKGGSLVLEAFRKALKTNPKLELIIVGQNDYTDKIKISESKIKVYGFLPINELQNIFNECSIFLMPAINEPWGLVYIEALTCKMPIIGLNRNGFPEISAKGEYGFGINNSNPDKLSEILLEAFSNPRKLADMGTRGQEYCLNTFTWKSTVSKIINTLINNE